MDDIWTQLIRYKMAEDRLNELKRSIWENLPFDGDVMVSIEEAEMDLAEIKQFIELNNPIKKVD